MAESALLRRSFSNPSETCFQQEGDPLRALGESVSFGRYNSESLAWEKWSTFSHNRYLEEAEKYSKPGSVAKMKAYFEAHYKKIGAKKQAALEQANHAPNSVEPDVEDTIDDSQSFNLGAVESNTNYRSSVHDIPVKETPDRELPPRVEPEVQDVVDDSLSLNPGAAEANSVHEFPVKEACDVELPPSVVVSSCGSCTETKESLNGETNVVETATVVDTVGSPVEAQVYQCKDPELNINVNESTSERKANQPCDALESDIVVATTERKVLIEKDVEKENLDSKSKRESAISCMKRSTKSNVSKLSSSLARFATPIRPKKESCGTPKSRKSAKEPLEEKKKPAPKLLNMSINSDAILTKKDSQAFHKTRMGKVFTPLGKIIRDSFASSPAPSRASVSSVSRHTSATPHTETRRSRVALEKTFDKSRKLEQKLQSPSVGNTKSSMQSPAPTTFSSFNFRTEERAAKRRELFQKRIEKEAEKMQLLDKAKVKAKTDFRKSFVNLRANPSEDVKTEVLSDNINKIPHRRTESPKRKDSRPPQSQRSIGFKGGAEKTKAIPTQSSTLLTKKKKHENASPNIL